MAIKNISNYERLHIKELGVDEVYDVEDHHLVVSVQGSLEKEWRVVLVASCGDIKDGVSFMGDSEKCGGVIALADLEEIVRQAQKARG